VRLGRRVLFVVLISCPSYTCHRSGGETRSIFEQEAQERLRDGDAVVVDGASLHAALVDVVGDDARFVSGCQNLLNDFAGELWVSLDGDEASLLVHELRLANGRLAEPLCLRRVCKHNVPVHLV
jgi:hypothetical protein